MPSEPLDTVQDRFSEFVDHVSTRRVRVVITRDGQLPSMATRDIDRKRLWGRAGARCSMCRTSLTEVEGEDSIVGEEAHIRSGRAGGPRYDPCMPTELRI